MVSVTNHVWHLSLIRILLSLALVVSASASSQAAILNSAGLTTVRVWESTGPMVAFDFAQGGPQMTAQIGGPLGPSTFDFAQLANENYDVFYSDKFGNLNLNGNYVTVEAVYPNDLPAGGGLNLGAVDLIVSGSPIRADILASWVGLGNNYIAGSELLAVDVDNFPLAPTTDTTMGSTSTPPGQHLRVTVSWTGYVPEPGSALLAVFGLVTCVSTTRRTVRDRTGV